MSTPHLDPLVSAIAEAVIERIGARVTALRPRLLTIAGAAKYLSMTEDAIRHKVTNGKLRAVRADRFLRFDVRDLDVWIEANKG
jgi:excisionase family DNA binding protein